MMLASKFWQLPTWARFIIVFTCAMILLLLFCMGLRYFTKYNDSPSVPVGLYLTVPALDVEKGNLYTITIPDQYFRIALRLNYRGNGTLLKQAVAVPNDTIQITESSIYVNGVKLESSSITHYVRGIDLKPQTPQIYTLKPCEYWFMGTNDDSFDSRYFGVIRCQNIKQRAIFITNHEGVQTWQKTNLIMQKMF